MVLYIVPCLYTVLHIVNYSNADFSEILTVYHNYGTLSKFLVLWYTVKNSEKSALQ
jgi:hypothetical protein